MEKQVAERYGLNDVKIAISPLNDEQEIKKCIGLKAADYLDSIASDGDIIGVGWGTTLHQMSHALHPKVLRGSQIIQLEGGVPLFQTGQPLPTKSSRGSPKTTPPSPSTCRYPSFSTRRSSRKWSTRTAISSGSSSWADRRQYFRHPASVRSGPRRCSSAWATRTAKRMPASRKNAVGDICSRFYDSNGEIADEDLDKRTVGIELSDLRNKEYSILISGGSEKVRSIQAALKGRYANVLITDQFTAGKPRYSVKEKLLQQPDRRSGCCNSFFVLSYQSTSRQQDLLTIPGLLQKVVAFCVICF